MTAILADVNFNYRLLDFFFKNRILECDAAGRDACLKGIAGQIHVFQVCVGFACTSLLGMFLTKATPVVQMFGGFLVTVILGSMYLAISKDPDVAALRKDLGDKEKVHFAVILGLFSTLATWYFF